MNCLVGSPLTNSVESKWTRFEYWYGVETSSNDVESFRYDLESLIYRTATEKMVWCTQTGGRRVEEKGKSYYVDDQGRHLGIMAISSAPIDIVQTNITCPQALLRDDDNCFLIQGIMTLMSHAEDDPSMSIDYIRQEIRSAMDSDTLLSAASQGRDDSSGLASITRVAYLGDSITDVLSSTPTVSGGIEHVASIEKGDQGHPRSRDIIIGSLCGLALVIIGAALLVTKRRQRKPSPRAHSLEKENTHTFNGDTIVSYHEDDDDARSSAGSSEFDLRAQALEAERQFAMEKGLGTIDEDATYHSGSIQTLDLVPADASHLGSCSSYMDVKPCHSLYCKQCRDNGVVFIPRNWQPDMTPSEHDLS